MVSGAAWGRVSTPENRKKRETSGEWGAWERGNTSGKQEKEGNQW